MCLSKQGVPREGKLNVCDVLAWEGVLVEEPTHKLSKGDFKIEKHDSVCSMTDQRENSTTF